ncbi:hypothetical protein ACWCQ1_46965, partial [Streptomyces sp. NPDC002144]
LMYVTYMRRGPQDSLHDFHAKPCPADTARVDCDISVPEAQPAHRTCVTVFERSDASLPEMTSRQAFGAELENLQIDVSQPCAGRQPRPCGPFQARTFRLHFPRV